MEEVQQTVECSANPHVNRALKALLDYLQDLHLRRASRGILPNFDIGIETQIIKQKISALTADDFNLDITLINKIIGLLIQLSLKDCQILIRQRMDTFKNHESHDHETNPTTHQQSIGDCEPKKKRLTLSSKVGQPSRIK